MTAPLIIAMSQGKEIVLLPQMANRHGLITGATGTGKTVTLQKMAESFASIGVPVFMADVKGDLSGIGAAGVASGKIAQTAGIASASKNLIPAPTQPYSGMCTANPAIRCGRPYPTWDRCCWRGCSISTKPSPAFCTLVFKIADDNGLLLLDLKDLRAMIQFVGDNAKQFTTEYGNISAASIGAIQRGLLTLERTGRR